MNAINWKPKAARQLMKLEHGARAAVRDAVTEKLSVFPRCTGVKALTGHQYGYRLRVGDYRVLFDFVGDEANIISVEEVRKRDEHTY